MDFCSKIKCLRSPPIIWRNHHLPNVIWMYFHPADPHSGDDGSGTSLRPLSSSQSTSGILAQRAPTPNTAMQRQPNHISRSYNRSSNCFSNVGRCSRGKWSFMTLKYPSMREGSNAGLGNLLFRRSRIGLSEKCRVASY